MNRNISQYDKKYREFFVKQYDPNAFENNITTAVETNPAPLTHSATPTFQPTYAISQPNNIVLQEIYNSIKALKKSAKSQLQQANEIKDQLKQFLTIQQQQSPMPRHLKRTHAHRPHPYLYNERPLVSRTPTSVSAAPTDHHDNFILEQHIFSNNSHPQQAAFPGSIECFSASSQNPEFFDNDNNTYDAHESNKF